MCHSLLLASPVLVQRRTQQQEQLSFRYREMIKCQTLPNRGEQVWLVALPRRPPTLFTPKDVSVHTPADKNGFVFQSRSKRKER